jgi:hypothetical protein
MVQSFIAALALLQATTSAAPAAQTPEEIVVTGEARPSPKRMEQAVSDVTISRDLQIARFHDAVCPLVVGLTADATTVIQDRIADVAGQVGIRVDDRSKCDANLIVIFAGDGRALLSDIRTKRPNWLDGVSPAEVDRMMKDKGPVRAWSATSVRNEDGRMARDVGDDIAPTMRVMSASFLTMPTRQHIDGSVIVIDLAAADGRTLTELADYAAMRGLSMTRPPNRSNVSTILSLFEAGADAPRQLTRFDLGYLRALYAADGTSKAVLERGRIAGSLAEYRR